jgi:signal transduction histidine kinase
VSYSGGKTQKANRLWTSCRPKWLKKWSRTIGPRCPEGILFTRAFSEDLPKVFFDPGKMGRVMTNLLDNAIHAVRERVNSGEAESGLYEPEIRVSAARAESGIKIEIEDNGVGMDEETVRRAFEPLFTTKARGTGLGLAIVKKIVKEHGGTMKLESQLHGGTKAILWIPVRQGVRHRI